MREHLKLQQELFLSFLLDRLILPNQSAVAGSRKSELESQLDASTWDSATTVASTETNTPQREKEARGYNLEAREMMMEVLGHLSRGQTSLLDLWVNYDCNVECEDLFERLVKFLSRVRCAFLLEFLAPHCIDESLRCTGSVSVIFERSVTSKQLAVDLPRYDSRASKTYGLSIRFCMILFFHCRVCPLTR